MASHIVFFYFSIMDMNVVGWFEIPVTDMERAIKFYETVFEVKLDKHQVGPFEMAWFPMVEKGPQAAGSLVKSEGYNPGPGGVLVYFTSTKGDVEDELSRVEEAGGTIIKPRYSIGEHGFAGIIQDTEGNHIAVHSMT